MSDVHLRESAPVLTDGWGLYVRIKRGAYRTVNRWGEVEGVISTGFTPRPRWREARLCSYVIREDGLTCPRCGRYDNQYAQHGVRSYCANQMSRKQALALEGKHE